MHGIQDCHAATDGPQADMYYCSSGHLASSYQAKIKESSSQKSDMATELKREQIRLITDSL